MPEPDELLAPLVLPEIQPVLPVAHAAFDLNQPIEQLPLEDFAVPEDPLLAAESDNLGAESPPQPQREIPVPEPLLQHNTEVLPVDFVSDAPINVAEEVSRYKEVAVAVIVGFQVPAKPLRFEHWGAHKDLSLPKSLSQQSQGLAR